MSSDSVNRINSVYRILDANINRTQEGLRVCEDTARFILNNYYFARKLKNIRHRLNTINTYYIDKSKKNLLKARNIEKDKGKESISQEMYRQNFKDILFANFRRVEESLRVLEEFSKLVDKSVAQKYKNIRYEIYGIEKKIALSI
ncbi:MAG: thiamine-phosphate pyrophosphorylase [Candidatus Omnitrophica bacterium]|nr:thiamine-phosphate pyrophosphorylase [Candidatus Omnitrophota bacterium]